jgi:hypothetical protein
LEGIGKLNPKTPTERYKATVLWRVIIWTIGHSQEGIRPGRELIGDRGIKRSGILDSRKSETPKPNITFPVGNLFTVRCRGRDREREDLWVRFSKRFQLGNQKR